MSTAPSHGTRKRSSLGYAALYDLSEGGAGVPPVLNAAGELPFTKRLCLTRNTKELAQPCDRSGRKEVG
jgi:hypothetical protein